MLVLYFLLSALAFAYVLAISHVSIFIQDNTIQKHINQVSVFVQEFSFSLQMSLFYELVVGGAYSLELFRPVQRVYRHAKQFFPVVPQDFTGRPVYVSKLTLVIGDE